MALVGSAYVAVRPDLTGFQKSISKELRSFVNDFKGLGVEAGQQFASGFKDGLKGADPFEPIRKPPPDAPKAGDKAGGAFADAFKRRVEAALRSLPDVEVGADATDAEKKIAELRGQLQELSDKKIGIDVTGDEAIAKLEAIRAEYEAIDKSTLTIDAKANVTQAIAALDAFKADVDRLNGVTAEPTIDVKLDPAGQTRLTQVRASLDQLAARVAQARVDANTVEAQAKVSALEAQLLSLGKQTARPDIDLQGVAQAEAQVFALSSSLTALSGKRVSLGVDFDGAAAIGGVKTLGIALAALTAIPFGEVVAGGLGAIASAASVAGAGIVGMAAASLPGIKRIGAALQAQKAAQDQVTRSTQSGTSAAVQGLQAQQRAIAMAQARRQLEQAVANAAQQHAQALQQVQQAEQSLADAQRNATQAQQALNAARAQAKRDAQDLANSVIDAGLAVRSAQLNLTDAQSALAAQSQATARAQSAVADAKRRLADAQAAAAKINGDPNATGSARASAAQQVADAKKAVTAAQQAAKAQELAQKKAQLAYDEAVQSLKEQRLQLRRLQSDKAKADKAGIAGDAQVVAARRQVYAANEAVRRQEQQLLQARRNVARVDAQSAQQIRAAQQQVTQQRLADRLAALQQTTATNGASAATIKYGRALAALTGPERNLLTHFQAFQKAFNAWSKSLEGPVLGAWSAWLDTAGRHLGLLTPVTKGAAKAMTGLAREADKALGGPFWKKFSKDAGKAVGPVLTNLGRAAGNVARGLAGIIDAFLPYLPGLTKGVGGLAKKFGDWGQNLGGSDGFKTFIDDIKQNAPTIKAIFKDLGTIFTNIGKALKDMGPGTLQGLKTVLDALAKLPPSAIQALVVVGGSAAVGSKGGLGGALGLTGAATSSYQAGRHPTGTGLKGVSNSLLPIGAGIGAGAGVGGKLAGPMGALVGGAIGGAIAETTQFVGLFQSQMGRVVNIWKTTWNTVGGFIKTVWNGVTGWFATAGNVIGAKFTYIKGQITGAWSLAWRSVSTTAHVVWAAVAKWLRGVGTWIATRFTAIKNTIVRAWTAAWNWVSSKAHAVWNALSKWLGGVGTSIRNRFNSIRTSIERAWTAAWNWIVTKARSVWSTLSGFFTKTLIPGVRNAFTRAVHAIQTAWSKVASVAKKPINFVISTVYDKGIKGTWDKVADWLHLGSKWHAPYIKPLAEGGVLGGDGGGESHTAQIAPAGAMRLWAEPETGGEAYIPMSPKKRGRSTAILNTVANEFGYGLTPFADGGIVRFANGGLFDWVKNTFSKIAGGVTNVGKGALSFLTNPAGFIKGKVAGSLNKIPGVDSPYGAAGKALGGKVLDQVLAFAKQVASVFGTGGAAMKALKLAESRLGIPYVWGGTSWNSGMDCSGLTMLSYRKAGISIPRTSQSQWGAVKHIPVSQAQPGDLLFSEFGGAGPGHVGLRTQYPINSSKASFNEPHTGAVASYRSIGGWTKAGVVPGAHAATFAGTPGSTQGGRHAGPAKSRAWAQAELPEFGWRGQFGALNNIWNHESGWRWYADNPFSTAYGIPQALPGSKMRSAGADWHDNSYTQMRWGLGYIRGRYGSPNNAWRFWKSHHWYDEGGTLPPGIHQVVNASRKPEAVLSNSQWQAIYAAARGTDGASQVHEHFHFDGLTRSTVESHVRAAVQARDVAKGRQLQPGRRR